MSSPAFYLGRKQKIFGPLTLAQVEALRNNGQIEGYSWIWMPGAQEWTALDAAPPAPPANVTSATTVEPIPAVAPPRKAPDAVPPPFQHKEVGKEHPRASAKELPKEAPKQVQNQFQSQFQTQFKDTRIAKARDEAFRAILFDGRNAVTAWVSEATSEGCEIRATEQGPDPFFVHKANAMIHLHEVATGRTTKIPVRVSDVYRQDHHWVYKVRWTSVPSIFAPSRAA